MALAGLLGNWYDKVLSTYQTRIPYPEAHTSRERYYHFPLRDTICTLEIFLEARTGLSAYGHYRHRP